MIKIDSPDGPILLDQDRKFSETTDSITVADHVAITLPQKLRHLVDTIPFCLFPRDVTDLQGWKTLPEKPDRAAACLCVYDVRDGMGCEWMTCAFDPASGVFFSYNGSDVTRYVQKWMLLPKLEPPFYEEAEE